MADATPKVSLCSVSSGTMLHEDLIPTFWDVYQSLVPEDVWKRVENEWSPVLVDCEYEGDVASECLDMLFEALDELAPEYCYFGANEGDGADYGFWICWDAIKEAIKDGELDSGEDTPEWDGRDRLFLQVNDHGNATLYSYDGTEIWSTV